MTIKSLSPLGWKPFFEQQLGETVPPKARVVRVSAHHGSQVLLIGEQGEFSAPVQLVESRAPVAVGDWLVIDQDSRTIECLERSSLLSRRPPGKESKLQLMAANVDTLFIVSSCNQEFNLSRIERYLAITLQSGATPVVVLTKSDLCHDPSDLRRQVERLHSGLLVETVDARSREQVEVLTTWCRTGQTIALLGSSGVGKSTLANALGASDLSTGDIREKDGKGRHTTTTRSLICLPTGGVLIDTPGMRELQIQNCEEGIADLFDDVFQIAARCRFNDCGHNGDVGCAIAAALESGELDERRVNSFKKLLAEEAFNARSLAERRERDRGFGRMYKSVINEKRRRRGDS